MRKRQIWLILLMVTLVLLSGAVSACTGKAGVCGEYVNQDNPEEYLIIKKDGTFISKEYAFGSPLTVTGDWDLEDDTIILSWMGFGVEGEVRGNKIIDNEGKVWVKQ